jgi:integrase
MAVEAITTREIERWIAGIDSSARTRNKLLIMLHGILGRARKVYELPTNAAAEVEKVPQRRSGDIEVFSPEEVWALVRAAGSEQDEAIFLTAAFTGLRMGELLALRWRDVDLAGRTIRVRASYYAGQLTTPNSGKVRAVPMAPDVATALAQVGRRENWVGDDELVFAGDLGGHLDGSALRRRYKMALQEARPRPLRFHDLRHTFGTRMTARPTSAGYRSGWATLTSRRRCGTCTTRRGRKTASSSPRRSGSPSSPRHGWTARTSWDILGRLERISTECVKCDAVAGSGVRSSGRGCRTGRLEPALSCGSLGHLWGAQAGRTEFVAGNAG